MERYDIIVVGAGPGGVTVASLLANAGQKVLLVDKNERPGGRMMTLRREGFSYELFPINCVPQHNSLFEELSRVLGKQDRVRLILGDDFGIGTLFYEDRAGKLTSWRMGFRFPEVLKMLGFLGVKPWRLRSLWQMARVAGKLASMTEADIAKLYTLSAMAYLDSLGPMPPGFRTFLLATFGEGAFEMTSDRVAAGEMVRMFQTTVRGSGGRYYEGGVGHFFEVMAQTVEEKGGKILMNTRVASIDVREGKAVGITTQNGEAYAAPVVVSNGGIRQTVLGLVGEDHFDREYVERIKGLESNLACVGYRYFTSRPVLATPMMVLFPEGCVSTYGEFEAMERGDAKPEKGYIYLGTTSLYPGMAPQNRQVIYAVASCLPDPGVDPGPYLAYIEKGVRKMAPQLYEPGVIARTEVMTPALVPSLGNDAILPGQGGEAYGIANSLGQAGPRRPGGDTPIGGLYVVGNDTEGFGLGTHQAVDSGFRVYGKVMGWLAETGKAEVEA